LERIQKYAAKIRVTGMDAVPFIQESAEALGGQVLFCIDPPYCEKGQRLYTNFYRSSDHVALRGAVASLPCPWIVTYDNVPLVQELYSSYQQFTFNIQYSAANKGIGSELLIAPETVFVPHDDTVKRYKIERRLAA
jgi:DNA adenine methylase